MERKSFAGVLVALAALVMALAAPAGAAPKGLIAPASACPNQTNLGASAALQVKAMRCMTNYARRHRDRPPLSGLAKLNRAARGKSGDILRCDEFSHEACGREFTYWFKRVDYRGRCTAMGENIAWGTGSLGSVRKIFSAWIGSPGHRENILGNYQEIGIGLRVGTLEGNRGAHVWTQEFGSRTC